MADTATTKVWKQLAGPGTTSLSGPSARFGAAMSYAPGSPSLLLFGGFDNNGNPLNDTWAWNGYAWTQLKPLHSPPARGEHPWPSFMALVS